MHDLLDPTQLVKNFGYIGLLVTIFLESGIVIGFFLPGDSLLFAAGLLASQHQFNLILIIILAAIGAILGNNAGYATGKRFGPALLQKDGKLFSKDRVNEAHAFFEEKGPEALILARFVPAVRTFVPIVAGSVDMNYRKFFTYNAIGGCLWGIGLPVLGYSLGKSVPNIDKYLLPVVILIIVLSALPAIFHYKKRKG